MSKAWPVVKLGEVLTERQETPDLVDLQNGTTKIISKISFNTGKIDFRADSQTKTGMILIRPGDIVISGINAAKGAIAIYNEKKLNTAAATIHYGAYSVDSEQANIKFLWWLLRSNTFKEILNKNLPSGIKTELKAKRLLPIEIPLPPLVEQQRIVAKIERLVGKIEEAHKISAQSRSAADILTRLYINKITSRFPCIGQLKDFLIDKPRNGWSAACDNADDGVAVLTLSAITGFHYNSSAYKKTSLTVNEHAHYWLNNGDLLITRSNTPDLVGHAAIYNGIPTPCIYPDLIMKIAIDTAKADTQFVWYWLQSQTVRKYIMENAKGTSPTMKKISQGTVMCIPFPVGISIEKQRQIAYLLNVLQKKIESLKSNQAQTIAELNALLPSILDKAFKGEL